MKKKGNETKHYHLLDQYYVQKKHTVYNGKVHCYTHALLLVVVSPGRTLGTLHLTIAHRVVIDGGVFPKQLVFIYILILRLVYNTECAIFCTPELLEIGSSRPLGFCGQLA